MTTKLILIGAGGFARETASVMNEINRLAPGSYEVAGFLLDEGYELDDVPFPFPVYRGIDTWSGWHDRSIQALCCVGDPADRRKIVARIARHNVRWATVIHPWSSVGFGCTVGEGSIVSRWSGATANVTIGKHVHLNNASGVGHDSRIGDYVTISSFAEITGKCVVEDDVFVGSHAVVLPGVHVGRGAKIGAGSVVTRSVPEGATVFGNPAKRVDS